MTTLAALSSEAERLARQLREQNRQLVLAESCTGGLTAATLTQIPGISAHFCGSAVVYQEATKVHWLEVPQSLLETAGVVSRAVAREMAQRVLVKTPQADLAAAITGHLGPEAPAEMDGLLYICVTEGGSRTDRPNLRSQEVWLKTTDVQGETGVRIGRQMEAAHRFLQAIGEFLTS